jgi:hypothetical protein
MGGWCVPWNEDGAYANRLTPVSMLCAGHVERSWEKQTTREEYKGVAF